MEIVTTCFLTNRAVVTLQEQPVSLLPGHNHVALVNGLNCRITVECDFFNGSLSATALTVPNVPKDTLTTFKANFQLIDSPTCVGGNYSVFSSFSDNVTDGNGLVLFLSERIRQSQLDWVVYPNFLAKPSEGGALLFTIFNLKNYSPDSTFREHDKMGSLSAHTLSTQDSTTFGFLDKFEVEVKGHNVEMSVGNRTTAYKLEQGATYIQVISGDLRGVRYFRPPPLLYPNQLMLTFSFVGCSFLASPNCRQKPTFGVPSTHSILGDYLR